MTDEPPVEACCAVLCWGCQLAGNLPLATRADLFEDNMDYCLLLFQLLLHSCFLSHSCLCDRRDLFAAIGERLL